MNTIKISPAVKFLSDFPEFDSLLDRGKVIVDKEVCGCGATEYYLRLPDTPVLLLSPRKLLIETKMDSNPTPEELKAGIIDPQHRPYEVIYFDRSKRKKLNESIAELRTYLKNRYQISWFTPKIMVTYDSFPIVLKELHDSGLLSMFTIVVDEFNALFTDVKLKGTKELNVINLLNELSNHVVFLSATPIDKKYLAPIPAFANLPYYQLEWDPSRIQRVRVRTERMSSALSKINEILEEYCQRGYFKSTMLNGKEVRSTEAVFFLNSVSTIVKVIKRCGLTPSNTLVLCADNNENKRKLASTNLPFKIGKPYSAAEYKTHNKPITLVTRVCFEGADMYSDCSCTYVFSDCNQDNLNLDLCTDLLQIAGRCRSENPFKSEIRLYYKTPDAELISKAQAKINKREENTNLMLPNYSSFTDPIALMPITISQNAVKYNEYYLDVEIDPATGQAKVVVNELARQADLRALDIKINQYKSGYSVSHYCQQTHSHQISNNEHIINNLWKPFTTSSDFSALMKLYIDTMTRYPELNNYIEYSLTEIPIVFKQYFHYPGPDVIKSLGYNRGAIEGYIQSQANQLSYATAISIRLLELLIPGKAYTNAEVKTALATVYKEFEINRTAKATEITQFLSAQPCKLISNNQRKNGYKIYD